MKKLTLIALLIGFSAIVFAQVPPNRCSYITPRQTDNWYFRDKAGIRFTETGGIVTSNPPSNPFFGNGSSVLSDEAGELLLYSNGKYVWNKYHERIDEVSLDGDGASSQPALIIQNPSKPQMLYIFTTDVYDGDPSSPYGGLKYSRADLSARAGHGTVVETNVTMSTDVASFLCGVKQSDNINYWVLTHKLGNNEFYAYKVSESGVDLNPVTSSAGAPISNEIALREASGVMKISPKGDKIALASFGKGTVQLFSFDRATGVVSNPSTINVPIISPVYGPNNVEFSPDGTKLYVTVTHRQSNLGQQNYLYQYDLTNGNLETKINDTPLSDDVIAIQLGRDGKIYVLRKVEPYMGIIENPNRPGTDCNYNENGFLLGGALGDLGLPNFVSTFLDIPAVDYDYKCDLDAVEFRLLNTSNIDGVDWDFGDPTSPDNNVFGQISPTHIFTAPGTYTINYTEHYNANSWTNTFQAIINPLPPKPFPFDSSYIVNGSSIQIYGTDGMYSYFWQDGSTNGGYNIDKEGIYTLLQEDMNCCQIMDTVEIVNLKIYIPTAFSPDNNGINETFSAIAPEEAIVDFTMSVFNKWGQVMWETYDINGSWDGKKNGIPAPAGLYNWHMSFNVKGNTMNEGMIRLSGTIMLFR